MMLDISIWIQTFSHLSYAWSHKTHTDDMLGTSFCRKHAENAGATTYVEHFLPFEKMFAV